MLFHVGRVPPKKSTNRVVSESKGHGFAMMFASDPTKKFGSNAAK